MKFNFFKKIWGKKKQEEKEEKKHEEKVKKDFELKTAFDFKILPLITEKSLRLSKEGKYTFLVDPKINKSEIKKVIERMFNVNVESVKTINYRERIRGLTKIKDRRKKFKKALIEVKAGQTIPLFE